MQRNHAQLPQTVVPIGDAAHAMKFAKSGLPGDDWVPTVVNPAEKGTMVDKALFWTHLLVWVIALILTCITNFGASAFMSNSTNASWDGGVGGAGGSPGPTDYAGTTTTTQVIGILGGVASILGVVTLLASAAWFDKDEFAGTGIGLILNVVIQFLTLYGTSATFYIFAQSASVTTNGFYSLSVFATIFMVYAQVLLYCTSSAIGVAALPRAFIPSLAASVQFISALAISSGDFAPAASNMQKTIAWLVPIFTIISLIMMFGLRIATQPGGFLSRFPAAAAAGSLKVSNIKNRPFLRSLILTPYLVSGILSVYKLSFVKLDPDPTSYVFAFFGMLLNFAIIGVVFNPSAELAGIDDDVA